MVEHHRIGVPPGTRLQALMRVDGGWMVWTAINNPGWNASRWLGTYLLLADDGSVTRISINSDGSEDVWLIRPRDEEARDER